MGIHVAACPIGMATVSATKTSLANAPVHATISCTNMKRAKTFYTETLGLPAGGMTTDEGFSVKCGNNTELYIYQRNDAPKAENTACSWHVNNVENVVNELRERGVKFEEYNLPNLKTVKGIATQGGFKGAWFKDPDGNILAISQQT